MATDQLIPLSEAREGDLIKNIDICEIYIIKKDEKGLYIEPQNVGSNIFSLLGDPQIIALGEAYNPDNDIDENKKYIDDIVTTSPDSYKILLRAGTRFNDDSIVKTYVSSNFLFANAYEPYCYQVSPGIYITQDQINRNLLYIFIDSIVISANNIDQLNEDITTTKKILEFFNHNQ